MAQRSQTGNEAIWTVYGLHVAGRIVYVGVTTRPLDMRLREHRRIWTWAKQATIIAIDTVSGTKKAANSREKYWVWNYLRMGYDLLNVKHVPSDREAFLACLRQQPAADTVSAAGA